MDRDSAGTAGFVKLRSVRVVGVLVALAVGGGAAAALAGASSTTISWSLANSSAPSFSRMACPSSTLCVGLGPTTVAVSTDPTGGSAGDWSTGPLPNSTTTSPGQIACAGTAVCVTTQSAYIDYSTTPGVATSWSSVKILGTGGPKPVGAQAACTPSGPVLCVVDFGNGNFGNGTLYASTNPAGGASAWKALPTPSGWDPSIYEDTGLSCPTSTFCAMIGDDPTLGVDGQGAVWTTNPTAASPTWSEAPIDPTLSGGETLKAISCPSSSLCVVGDANNSVLASSTPSGGWDSPVDLDTSQPAPTSPVDCPTAGMCVVAIDDGGATFSSTDPTGAASAWSADTASGSLGSFNGFSSLSCPSSTLCIGSDGGGNIVVGTPSTGTTTTTNTNTTSTHQTPPPPKAPSGTKITKSTIKKTTVTFTFKGTNATGFQCGLVGPLKKHKPVPKLKFTSCKSPKMYKQLKKGSYSFAVRGVDSAGVDPRPASHKFEIK